jgi:phosphoglycerate dehydrogenase-like enzyme
MAPALTRGMLCERHLRRLESLCELPDPEPLASFDEPRSGELLGRAEILLTGWGCPPLAGSVLERAPALRAVIHAAGTVKGLVTDACWARPLVVSSAVTANAVPVAEYTLAAILFANKRVFELQRRYRELRAFRLWPDEFPDLGNFRKRIGLVGASRVGRRVLELLAPFDFEVLVSDPYLSEDQARELGARLCELDQLLSESDVVSLHAPSLPETRHLLDRRRLSTMRDGATLINTGRGALVDQAALEAELVSGRISAVIDTTEPEVLPADSPLYELPNVFLTPHVAGAMGAETERMADLAIDEVERFAKGEELAHAVRRGDLERIA